MSSVDIGAMERASGAPDLRGGKPHHQPQLDGIRGIAILAVLLSHAATLIRALPNAVPSHYFFQMMIPGWGGVDLFFGLSGFLITGILLRGRTSRSYFRPFYARRVLRIFPIYYLFLTVSLLVCTQVPALRQSLQGTEAHIPATLVQRVSYFVYLQNLPVFWHSLAEGLGGLWGGYWSLAVEEQFYFFWPALVRFVRSSALFWTCIAGFVAGPFVRALISHHTGETVGLLQFPISRLDGLFAGSALALYMDRRGKPIALAWSYGLFGAGAAILAFIAGFHRHELIQPGVFLDRIGISGFALIAVGLIATAQHKSSVFKPALTSRTLGFLGKYSYGIYIYHIGVFFAFKRMRTHVLSSGSGLRVLLAGLLYDGCAIAIALLIARISFRYIEAPALAMKRFYPSPDGAR